MGNSGCGIEGTLKGGSMNGRKSGEYVVKVDYSNSGTRRWYPETSAWPLAKITLYRDCVWAVETLPGTVFGPIVGDSDDESKFPEHSNPPVVGKEPNEPKGQS